MTGLAHCSLLNELLRKGCLVSNIVSDISDKPLLEIPRPYSIFYGGGWTLNTVLLKVFLVVIPTVHLPPTQLIVQIDLRRAMASTSFQEAAPKPLIRRIRCAF